MQVKARYNALQRDDPNMLNTGNAVISTTTTKTFLSSYQNSVLSNPVQKQVIYLFLINDRSVSAVFMSSGGS